jgi:hypothetical protein
MVWEVKHVRFYPQLEDGDPGRPGHLIVARNVLKPDEVKYFVSNASPETRVQTLLLVAFSRWHVERCFEDEKMELGFDHYEGRKYRGLIRHQALTAVTHLFLERMRQKWGEKPGTDGLPDTGRCSGCRAIVVVGEESEQGTSGTHCREDQLPTTTERQSSEEPYQTDATESSRAGHPTYHLEPLLMG